MGILIIYVTLAGRFGRMQMGSKSREPDRSGVVKVKRNEYEVRWPPRVASRDMRREEPVMTQREVSGWAVGWTWFAAVMMWIIGAWHAIAGLVALVNDEFYVATREYIFQFDVTTWGWIHLIAGIVVFIAGIYLLSGQVWARTIAVIMANFML